MAVLMPVTDGTGSSIVSAGFMSIIGRSADNMVDIKNYFSSNVQQTYYTLVQGTQSVVEYVFFPLLDINQCSYNHAQTIDNVVTYAGTYSVANTAPQWHYYDAQGYAFIYHQSQNVYPEYYPDSLRISGGCSDDSFESSVLSLPDVFKKPSYPITYRPTHVTLSGPATAAVGATVNVDCTFPAGYGVKTAGNVSVTCNRTPVNFSWDSENQRVTFTMPDPTT